MKKLFYIFLIAFLFNSPKSNANCNFKEANYIKELSTPNKIKGININIPKSRDYIINFVRSLTSKSKNIPPNLRKKFNANLEVNYEFGRCEYKAKIWQNGDWKDHLEFKNGMPLRSLNVKLKNGNILNAVKFKLFLPKTRNGDNEILGTIISRKLGIITPETFEVAVNVNNINSLMIFQEDSRKEMLERNGRREGPMFKGDEDLLWSMDSWDNFELEDISLIRLINSNWFLKGASSKSITLSSYKKLLESYLEYSQGEKESHNKLKNKYVINIEDQKNYFQNFNFLMLIMNGQHTLRPHNSKFYFNSFQSLLEPIYYDGNIALEKQSLVFFNGMFKQNYKYPYMDLLKEVEFRENLLQDFKKRVLIFSTKRANFFENSLNNIYEKAVYLQEEISNSDNNLSSQYNYREYRDKFIKKLQERKLNQDIINSIELIENGLIVTFEDGRVQNITYKQFGSILKNNELNSKRVIYLPLEIENRFKSKNELDQININNGELIFNKSIKVSIDKKKKKIVVNQLSRNGWFLIKDADMKNWDIKFLGIQPKNLKISSQRFNEFGLTGCLNIYNSELKNNIFKVYNGACEDSLNIVNSNGNINSVEIYNAYQDGLDIDFSEIDIDTIKINYAGNDCLDLSSGEYFINKANLMSCNDKAISIGEKSYLLLNKGTINKALIGISVKDSSTFDTDYLDINNTNICIEAKNKKQEFEGGLANISKLKCQSPITQDEKSLINLTKKI
jgi:hypothetical protein